MGGCCSGLGVGNSVYKKIVSVKVGGFFGGCYLKVVRLWSGINVLRIVLCGVFCVDWFFYVWFYVYCVWWSLCLIVMVWVLYCSWLVYGWCCGVLCLFDLFCCCCWCLFWCWMFGCGLWVLVVDVWLLVMFCVRSS